MQCSHYARRRASTYVDARQRALTSTRVVVVIERVNFYCSIRTAHVDARRRTYMYVLIELSSIRTYMLRTFRRMSAHQYARRRALTRVDVRLRIAITNGSTG